MAPKMLHLVLLVVWIGGVGLSGCGSPGETSCSPGASRSCTCEDGESGTQQCRVDGSGFERCSCSGGPPGDATGGETADAGESGEVGTMGSVESGIDESREAAGLSPAERVQVCQAGVDYVDRALGTEDVCRWATHRQVAGQGELDSDADAVESCEQSYQAWIDEADGDADEGDGSGGEGSCESMPDGAGQGCTVSVGRWESCEQAFADRFVRYVRDLPVCSEVTAAYYEESYEPFFSGEDDRIPEVCESLREDCPEFFRTWVGPIKQR